MKKYILTLIITAAALLAAATQAQGADWYVDNSATGANNGTSWQDAWQSFTGINWSVVMPGDSVVVDTGDYQELASINASGAQGRVITVKSAVIYGAKVKGFVINGDFIRIEGFTITSGQMFTKGVWIRGDNVEVAGNHLLNIMGAFAVGSDVTEWNKDPALRVKNAYIARNKIEHCQYGIFVCGDNWLVEDNEVVRLYKYSAGAGTDADYSRFFGENHIFRNNFFHGTLADEIQDAHVDGFQTYDQASRGTYAKNVIIENNFVMDFHQGVMMEGHHVQKTMQIMIRNNVFAQSLPGPFGDGIIAEDIPYVQVINNTFYLAGAGGVLISENNNKLSTNATIKNNIIDIPYNQNISYVFSYQYFDANTVADYNLIYGVARNPSAPGAHDILQRDPLFMHPSDPLGPDGVPFTADDGLQLQVGSPAIRAGENSQDIGAYEYMPPIIPADRMVPWSAGIPGGIPHYSVGVNVKDFGAIGDGAHDDTTAIQNAINACPNGKAVLLPQGRYNVSQALTVVSRSIVLRGEGADKTVIIGSSSGASSGQIDIRGGGSGSAVAVTAGYQKDSTQITVSNASGLRIGDYATIQQDNDPAVLEGTLPSTTTPYQGQIVRITAINANTLTLARPLYYAYNPAMNITIKSFVPVMKAGIEDLKIEATGANERGNIFFFRAVNCWVKGVDSYNAYTTNISLDRSYACEIRDNFVHHYRLFNNSSGYGIQLHDLATDNLVENNILDFFRHGIIVQNGATGNVIGYNFAWRGIAATYPNDDGLMPGLMLHGGNPNMNLFEGNNISEIICDNFWGSSRNNTFFRNWSRRFSLNSKGNLVQWMLWAVRVDAQALGYNFVGNILTMPSDAGDTNQNHAVWLDGRDGNNTSDGTHITPTYPVDDPRVEATMIKHGNFDYVSGTIQWDPGITNHALPVSLYLSVKPEWFDNVPWPPIGFDVAGFTNKLPAQICFESQNLVNGGAFNASACYATDGLYGDVSGDGVVSAFDAALALQLGRGELEAGQIAQRAVE